MNSWSSAMTFVCVDETSDWHTVDGGEVSAELSVDVIGGGVANLALTPVAEALRVLWGVANGCTLPVSRTVVTVREIDLYKCLIINSSGIKIECLIR